MSQPTSHSKSFAWTEHDRSFILANGYHKADAVVSADETEALRKIYDDLFAGRRTLAADSRFKQLGGADGQNRKLLPQILGWQKSAPEILEMDFFKKITSIAKSIYPDCEFRGGHLILKPAKFGKVTPWHQDQAYHDPRYFYRTLNFWVPIGGATLEEGCMHYVPGSHKGVVVPHVFSIGDDPESALSALDQDYWDLNSAAVPCPSGSLSIHHSYTLHFAGPNKSENPRRALIAVFHCPNVLRETPLVFPWNENKSVEPKLLI